MAQGKSQELVALLQQQRVAERQLVRQLNLAAMIVAGDQRRHEIAAPREHVVLVAIPEPAEEYARFVCVARVYRGRERETARHETHRGIEADVVHCARHGFQPDDLGAVHVEPVDAASHDLLPCADALMFAAHGDGSHPAFDPRAVYDVERDDLAALAAPHHRPVRGVANRITPHRGVQERYAHADHAVAAVALRERLAEDLIELVDLIEPRGIRAVENVAWTPRARGRHQSAAPAAAYSSRVASSDSSPTGVS